MKLVRLLIICVCSGWLSAAGAWAGTRDLLAQSDDGRIWIARVENVPDGTSSYERTRLMYRDFFEQQWMVGPTAPARVVSIASANGQLLAVLPDGQWMILTSDDLRLGEPPPQSGRMVFVAADKNTPWAIVEVSSLAGPTTGPATRSTTLPGFADGAQSAMPADEVPAIVQPPTTRSTQPATNSAASHLVLYRLDGSQWADPLDLPLGIPDDSARLSMTVAGQLPVIAWQDSDHSIQIIRAGPSRPWSIPRSVSVAGRIVNFKLLAIEDRVELWVLSAGASGPTNAGEVFTGEDFSRSIPVPISNVALSANSPQVMAVAPSRMHWIANIDGKLMDRAYDDDLAPKTDVMAISPDQTLDIPVDECLMIAVGMVLLATMSALAQRRVKAEPLPTPEQIKLRLAPPGARVAAGLVDLLPLAAAFTMIRQALPTGVFPIPPDQRILAVLIIAVLTHLAHTLISELLCGQTIGKMLFGLRVIGADGKAAKPLGIVIRNLLRVVDYAVLPLSMIIFSPMHQRLGDVAGGTIVIATELPEPPAEEPAE